MAEWIFVKGDLLGWPSRIEREVYDDLKHLLVVLLCKVGDAIDAQTTRRSRGSGVMVLVGLLIGLLVGLLIGLLVG